MVISGGALDQEMETRIDGEWTVSVHPSSLPLCEDDEEVKKPPSLIAEEVLCRKSIIDQRLIVSVGGASSVPAMGVKVTDLGSVRENELGKHLFGSERYHSLCL